MSDNTTNNTENKEIGIDEVRITPAQAIELSEWVIAQTNGTYSAKPFDDRAKQALLVLLSTVVYDNDATNRENILIDVTKAVFGYSFACDRAENQFINDGWAEFSSGKWNTLNEQTIEETETEQPTGGRTFSERQERAMNEICQMLEMAMQSDGTPKGVKDCLYTIIFEASNEAGLPLGDVGLIAAAFPRIIEALPLSYGNAIYHSVQEILRLNTTAYDDFHKQKIGKETTEKVLDLSESSIEDLARTLSGIMHNPNLPAKIFNCLADELTETNVDFYSPENILANLENLKGESDA